MRKARPVAQSPWTRVGVFAGGLYIALYGLSQLARGVFGYHNYLRAIVYSPAIVGAGILIMVLVLIPASMVERAVRLNQSRSTRR